MVSFPLSSSARSHSFYIQTLEFEDGGDPPSSNSKEIVGPVKQMFNTGYYFSSG